MTRHPSSPCTNCPYRKDAPLRYWDRKEFQDLLASEDLEIKPFGSIYSCHNHKNRTDDARGMCAGWLLDQKKRGIPSIYLRVALSLHQHMLDAFYAVNDGGHNLFASVKSMCRANGVRPPREKK